MMLPLAAMPLAAPISPLPNCMTLVAKIFFAARELHLLGIKIAEAGHVGVPLAGELVGLDAIAIFALLVVTEVLAVPELVDIGLLRLEELRVIGVGALRFAEGARGFFGRAKGSEPEAAAVGADAANNPGIIGLIGIAAIFGDATAVIELLEIFHRDLHSGPHIAEELFVGFPGQNIVAVDHQDKFGVEILPIIGVLPAGLVNENEGVAFRYAEIVRDSADFLSLEQDGTARLLRLRDPETEFGILARYGVGE